jgi:hypothetical protein
VTRPPLPLLAPRPSPGPDLPHRSGRPASKDGDVQSPKKLLQCKRFRCFGHTQRNCGDANRCVACGERHQSVSKCVTAKQRLKCCRCEGNDTATCRGWSKWKEAMTAAAMLAREHRGRKDGASTRLPAPAKPSPEHGILGPGWNHVVQGGHDQPPLQLYPAHEDGPSGRLPQRVANVSPLVPKCRRRILSHPFPADWFNSPPITHSVSTGRDHRSPRPPHHKLRTADTPSLCGHIPPSRGSTPASCPQDHKPPPSLA